jgi:phospholipid-binding lipoprotein MlaA
MKYRVLIVLFLSSVLVLQGCASKEAAVNYNNSETEIVSVNDPLEKVNRVVFQFNIIFDKLILRPIAVTYRAIVPEFVRNRVTYSLNNLGMPITAVNNVLQGELRKAGVSTSRFIINSTVGILGFFDPAASMGLVSENEDFGQTLSVWGVESGPYLVLPFLGPSTPRDFAGMLSTSLLDPMYQVGGGSAPDSLRTYRMGTGAVDFRSQNIEILDDLQNNSIDYYAAVRSFYSQGRESQASNNLESNTQNQENDIFDDFDIDESYVGPDIEIIYD